MFNIKCKIMMILLWVLFGIASATEVHVSKAWKNDFGWEVTCSWKLYSNDSLQSVRLYNNHQQFLIYRPERDGTKRTQIFNRITDIMQVDCAEALDKGLEGKCILTMELTQPQKNNFTYTCEVSGERPMFIINKAALLIDASVPPTDAVVIATSKRKNEETQEALRVVLNCTSSGMPAPSLVWTIGDQKVPHDFTDSYWNVTSKLWHTWSQLSYTPSDEHPSAICTPEVTQEGHLETGKPAEFLYNSASYTRIIDVAGVLLLPLVLLR